MAWRTGLTVDPTTKETPSEQLRDKKAQVVFEVWGVEDGGRGEESLVGLGTVGLESVADALMREGSATSPVPVTCYNEWVVMRNPFTGKRTGKIYATVKIGLREQIERGGGHREAKLIQRNWRKRETPTKEIEGAAGDADVSTHSVQAPAVDASIENAPPAPIPIPSPPTPQRNSVDSRLLLNLDKPVASRPVVSRSLAIGKDVEFDKGDWKGLKEHYLRKSMEKIMREKDEDEEEEREGGEQQEGEGLVKYTLSLHPMGTSVIPLNDNDKVNQTPWGCYLRYAIPWSDVGGNATAGAGVVDLGEDGWGKDTWLWWDADSELLNGTSRHELFIPTIMGVADAVGREGVGIEVWLKRGEGDVEKVGTCRIKYEDLARMEGRTGVERRKVVTADIEKIWTGGELVKGRVGVEIRVRGEPKIVRVRRERREIKGKVRGGEGRSEATTVYYCSTKTNNPLLVAHRRRRRQRQALCMPNLPRHRRMSSPLSRGGLSARASVSTPHLRSSSVGVRG